MNILKLLQGLRHLPIPRSRTIPDPPAGRPALYADALSGRLILAVGSRRRRLAFTDELDSGAVSGEASRAPVSRSVTLSLTAPLPGTSTAYQDVPTPGAVRGSLVLVGYDGMPPHKVAGAPFAVAVAANVVRVGVPLTMSINPVPVRVILQVF